MASNPLDSAPADGLAPAFDLPEEIREHPDLVLLHGEISSRLRREAAGMPMNTVQQLLLERISFTYVLMKYKERTGGFARTNEQKDFYSFWISMTQEFNKLLMANQDKLRDALLAEVQTIVTDSLNAVTNREERQNARRILSEKFAEIEL